ncbi:uncharacterized protein LOC116205287 [Punica granatum]|uniref:PB1 domain-containing protein n=2 Tax=Punica granatum TaxID=22663 RepID=A0A218XI80_PUNGR|nr:uncharacterized protein LOC116205287 [Punica granatum]OWM84643.1 hypothetical protein CDL15_Pgr027430 [Punica granatum]PKI69945.1 hypothetical protein CRG98_009820 [Punica granatum]
MEPPLPVAPPAASSSPKLRLMCSYGGHIAHRPHTKSLFYSGGDTRIISIPAAGAATLSSFTAAVSSALSVPGPFTLKYQLPGHDLDSLISISSSDDLLILLDELPRLPPPSRIRLFLFSPKPAHPESRQAELTKSVLCHPKTETWFIDALNSARMMQKAENCAAGFGQNECLSGGGMISGAESIVLETNSSFGSTSSSVSLTNLPSGRPQDEDSGTNFPENQARLPVPDPAPSDNWGMNAVPHPHSGIYHEQVVKAAAFENRAALSTALDPENNTAPFPSFASSHQTVPLSGFPVQPFPHLVPTGTMYLSQRQHSVCLLPVPSTQPVYHLQPPLYHPPNPPHPLYVLPSNPTVTQPYGLPVQCGLAGPTGHPHSAISPMPSSQEVTESSNPGPQCTQQHAGLHQGQQIVHPVDFDQRECSSPKDEFDDDPARLQIYKSQPPLPTLPSQYQTMTKATTLLLSEALAQLHTDGVRQPIKPSQP